MSAQGDPPSGEEAEPTPTEPPVGVTQDEEPVEPREPAVPPTEPPVEETPEATPTPHPTPYLTGPGVEEEESEEEEAEERSARSPIHNTPPPAPTGLTVGDVTVTGATATVDLEWTGVFGAARYRVEYMGGLVVSWTSAGTTTATTTTVNALTCGEAYDFRVLARGDGITFQVLWSSASSTVSRTPGPCEVPPPPTGLSATGGDERVRLSWTSVSGGYRYKVEQWVSGSTWSQVSDSITGTSHTVTGLACDRTYFFRVSTRGDGSPYSTMFGRPSSFVSATTDAPCPDAPAPTGLRATGGGEMVDLRWNAVPDAHRYRVEQGVSGGTWGVVTSSVAGTTYQATGLECNTRYFFRVSTRGDRSPYSTTFGDPTSSVNVTTDPCPPVPAPIVSVTGVTDTSVSLSWQPAGGVALDDILFWRIDQQRTNGTWGIVAYTRRAATTHEQTGLNAGATYRFRVSARGDGHPYLAEYENFTEVSATTTASTPIVTIAAAPTTVDEGESITFTVRADPAPTTRLPVTVSVSEVGDCLAGTQPSSVTIPANQTSETFTVETEDDDVDEATCTVTGTLVAGSGYDLGTPAFASATVRDPRPTVTISASPTTVDEGDSITFTVRVNPAPEAELPVTVRVTDVGDCLTGSIPSPLTIGANRTFRTFTMGTEDDDAVAACTVTGTLVDADGYDLGPPATRSDRVTVLDHHPRVTISADPTKVRAGEPVVLTVTAIPAPKKNLTVSLDIGDSLLTGTPEPVSVPQGTSSAPSSSGSVTVTTSSSRTGTVTATVEEDASYAVASSGGSVDIAVVPGVTITGPSPAAEEGDTITYTVTASPVPSANLEVEVHLTQVGNFIRGTLRPDVTVPSTGPSAGTATLLVRTWDDALVEADGSVTATVVDGTGYVAATPGSASAAVEDNEPYVHITADPTTVSAGGSITFTLTARPAPNTARTVRVNVGNTLLSGTPPSTVSIPAGAGEESEATFSMTTADDVMGTVTATVQPGLQPSSGYHVGSPSSASVTVTRDPVVTVEANQDSITEGATMELVVTASPAPPAGTTLSVTVELGGVVSFLSDAADRTVDLTRDAPSATLSVPTADDSAVDGHGHVTATVLEGTGYRVGGDGQAEVFVWDNESPPPAPENVRATAVSETGLTLKWDDVEHATKYLVERPNPQTLSWEQVGSEVTDTAGATSYEFPVTGLECGTTYSYRVRTYGDGVNTKAAYIDPHANQTFSPSTEPCPTVSIAYEAPSDGQSATEGDTLRFTVTASHAPVGDLVVPVSVTQRGGTFLNGTPPLRETVTIPADGTSEELDVRTVQDMVYEPNGAVIATVEDGAAYDVSTGMAAATAPVVNDDTSLPGPTALSVEPLTGRRIKLTWEWPRPLLLESIPGSVTYIVEARGVTGGQGSAATGWGSVSPATLPLLHTEVDLDGLSIYDSDQVAAGADRPDSLGALPLVRYPRLEFRIRGTYTPDTGDPIELTTSQGVVVVDNPLLAVTGHAYAGARPPENSPSFHANLKWAARGDVSSYSIRYRPLLSYGAHSHSSESWRLTDSVLGAWGSDGNVRMLATSGGTRTASIDFLSRGSLYAVQLNFEEKLDPTCQDTQASPCPTRPGFSGRYAYVWASGTRPDAGPGTPERVATFPYYGHFPNRTFAYRICDEAFPMPEAEWDNWADAIQAGISVWSTSTGGLFQTSRNTTDDCPPPIRSGLADVDIADISCDGDGFWAFILRPYCQQGLNTLALAELVTRVVDRIYNAMAVGLVLNAENEVSEVRIVDRSVPKDLEVITSTYKLCILSGSHSACVTSPGYFSGSRGGNTVSSADIFFNWSKVKNRGHRVPKEVRWNTCHPSTGNYRFYRLAVHEAGHALGLSGASLKRSGAEVVIGGLLAGAESAITVLEWIQGGDTPGTILARLGIEELEDLAPELDYVTSHPTAAPTVMDYTGSTYSDCAPYPLDIMAINALYQKDYE
ncbi:MAG: fibronectin type III domain-containing protein [Chloroflexi bacterium]|nr:fibronectin type III domain-containing protein [Chloroflexota bacterium]